MPVRHQLLVLCKPLHWLFFPMRTIVVDVVKYLGLKGKKRSIDPPFPGLRFFRKFDDSIALCFKMAEAGGGPHGSERGEFAMRAMIRQ